MDTKGDGRSSRTATPIVPDSELALAHDGRWTAASSELARKHVTRLRGEMAACGCPKWNLELDEFTYCPQCADRHQLCMLLRMLRSALSVEATNASPQPATEKPRT